MVRLERASGAGAKIDETYEDAGYGKRTYSQAERKPWRAGERQRGGGGNERGSREDGLWWGEMNRGERETAFISSKKAKNKGHIGKK